MTEIVIVPAWRRADFLLAALDRLAIAMDDGGRYRVLIALDRDHNASVEQVARIWAAANGTRCTIKVVERPQHGYHGNSYNVLTAYQDALRWGAATVHLVEEDVLVAADYFQFHRDAHELVPGAFSVSACRNQNLSIEDSPGPDDTAVWTHHMYQSIGVSLRRPALELVMPHLTRAYFSNPVRYCRAQFPNSRINPSHAEQDGLLHRISEKQQMPNVYGYTPRAYHIGFIGYHRNGVELTGSIRERADTLLSMDADALNLHATTYKDHTVVDLDAPRERVQRVGTRAH